MKLTRFVLTLFVLILVQSSLLAQSAPPQEIEELQDFHELEDRIQATTADVRDAVVGIFITGGVGGASGSGCLISADGWIATAGHVSGLEAGKPCKVFLSDGREVDGLTYGAHKAMDYGLIKIELEEELPFAELGDSDKLIPGQWLIAMGHPLGREKKRKPVVRVGRVLTPRNPNDMVTMDVPVISGDSGGPVFDLSGSIVAINQSIAPQDVTLNNAAPISGFKELLPQLQNNEILGLSAQVFGQGGELLDGPALDPEDQKVLERAIDLLQRGKYQKALNLYAPLVERENPNVTALYNSACAYSLWSNKLKREKESKEKIEEYQQKAVELLLLSVENGWDDLRHMQKDPDLHPLREREDYLRVEEAVREKNYKPFLGIEITDLYSLMQKTSQPGQKGVFVASVVEDSPAAQAGFQAGDIITRINEQEVKGILDYANILSSLDLSKRTSAQVLRGDQELTLSFSLSDDPLANWLDFVDYRNGAKLHGLLDPVIDHFAPSIYALKQSVYDPETKEYERVDDVALATAVSPEGYLITKASQLGRGWIILVDDDGQEIDADLVAWDEESDLALLKAQTTFEHFISFDYQGEAPEIGSLLVAPNDWGDVLSYGAVAIEPYDSNRLTAPTGKSPFVGIRAEDTEEGGARILEVTEGSPAEKAGLEVGDLLLRLDGVAIPSWLDLIEMIREREVGEVITFDLSREHPELGATELSLELELVTRESVLIDEEDVEADEEPVKPGLGLRLREDESGEVVIIQVEDQGPADQAGLWEGDVLVEVGGIAVTSFEDVGSALVNKKPGESLDVVVSRSRTKHFGAMKNDRPTQRFSIVLGEKAKMTKPAIPGIDLENLPFAPMDMRGPRSRRADQLGEVIRYDGIILPESVGGIAVNLDGEVLGLNIARSDRTSTFLLPAEAVREKMKLLIQEAKAQE